MKAIGGYPEIELAYGRELHAGAVRLNTARNCFGEILRTHGYSKIFMPAYMCEVMYDTIDKHGIPYETYPIDFNFNPLRLPELRDGEALLYTNYLGLKRDTVSALAATFGKSLIVDNAQAFYEKPLEGIDTVYSPRKFFGVCDGGYLYCDSYELPNLERDHSYTRITPQLKRVDLSAQEGYADFKESEESLCSQPAKLMSGLTQRILQSIDYDFVKRRRVDNYLYLHKRLGAINRISAELPQDAVPLAYPLYIEDDTLRRKLISNSIFVPTYWPNVLSGTSERSTEHALAKYLIPLPVDQRYGAEEMRIITDTILR